MQGMAELDQFIFVMKNLLNLVDPTEETVVRVVMSFLLPILQFKPSINIYQTKNTMHTLGIRA
jgi:hypothetical protein